MENLDSTITIQHERRPCYVDGKPGGFPSNQSFVHFDKGIMLVGGLADKPCLVGAIREEDLVPMSIQEAIEQSDRRFAAIIQGIVDRAREAV